MTEQQRLVNQEGSAWFWKIFGGAIIGLISILLVNNINSINSNFERVFIDLRSDIKEVRQTLDSHKERLTAIEQGPFREKIAVLERTVATLQTSLDEHKAKIAVSEATVLSFKDEIKRLMDWNKELNSEIQMLREKMAVEMAVKKEEKK